MWVVVGTAEVDASRAGEGVEILTNQVLPGFTEVPGFVSATFARSADGTGGRSMVVFETEEAAKTVAATAGDRMPADAPMKIVSLEVCEVVASA